MRPLLRLLDDGLIERILDEARTVLAELGVEVHNPSVLALLGDHGARVDRGVARAWVPGALVDRAQRLRDIVDKDRHRDFQTGEIGEGLIVNLFPCSALPRMLAALTRYGA